MTRTLTLLAALICTSLVIAPSGAFAEPSAPPGFEVARFAGATPGQSGPDDIAGADGYVAVAWQNGIGPKGEPAPSGATQSDVVLYSPAGTPLHDWKVTGHVDGLALDPRSATLVATVNEDGNTSLFTISALSSTSQPVRYTYSPEPDASHTGGVHTGGGTDGVQVLPDGRMLITASAPNNGNEGPVPNATATFLATLDPRTHIAHLQATFADDARATDALTGSTVTLGPSGASPQALTDPDSNALVPAASPLYGGQYMLNSQGDQLLVFARFSRGRTHLTELPLSRGSESAGVDDVAWATASGGTLFAVDHKANAIYAITGAFSPGNAFAGLDTVGSTANTTELERLDLAKGALSPFVTGFEGIKGLLYMPADEGRSRPSPALRSGGRRRGLFKHADRAHGARG